MAYPTPPPTSSPKDHANCHHHDHDHYNHHGHGHQSFDTPGPPYHGPAEEPYIPPPQKIPAQDSYFPSYSKPQSPAHFYAPPSHSPINDHTHPNAAYPGPAPMPGKRRTPPPRPLYFSPTNKPPSPYNVGRPKPRPGFLQRIAQKISSWLRSLARWSRENPIKAGVATFIPVILGVGMVRAAKGLGGPLLEVVKFFAEGMGGGKAKAAEKKLEKEVEKEVKKEFGWGLDHFVGFGGSKAGPIDGIMRVLQMLM